MASGTGPGHATAHGTTLREELRRPVALTAWAVALLFWWASVRPTLLPRAWWAQGVVGGVALAVGIGVGTAIVAVARAAAGPLGVAVPERARAAGRRVVVGAGVLVFVVGSVQWVRWQDAQRELVRMEPIAAATAVPAVAVALLVGALLVAVGRIAIHPARLLDRAAARHMPRAAAHLLTAVVVVVSGTALTRDLVLDPAFDALNDRFATFDTGTPDGIEQPTSPLRAGGPGSLVAWDTLGYEGRHFAGGGPTQADLEAFAGPGAEVDEPIRAYVGLQSADDPEKQAALAVEELDRTGAWDREVVVIATVTGTGWVDPVSAAAVELMHGGDSAIVAIQYSYLPSWISFLVDTDEAAASGEALVSAVVERWEDLPDDDRPRLVAFGLSLGSFGSESAFHRGDIEESLGAAARVDGVLWAGPTFANPVWHQVLDARDPASPVWHPRYGDGTRVQVMGRPGAPPTPGRDDPMPDVVYLTHPSDPVTWASVDTFWRVPAWMDAPVGYDVPTDLLWFPVVTGTQTVFDLMAGFSATPGHGHNYDPNMAGAWAAVAAPDDWSAADTERLRAAVQPWAA